MKCKPKTVREEITGEAKSAVICDYSLYDDENKDDNHEEHKEDVLEDSSNEIDIVEQQEVNTFQNIALGI